MVYAWLITSITIDFVVIAANFIEQILIFKKWSSLDRIDHLLLSLSFSDLISGITMIVIDTWTLSLYAATGSPDSNSNLSDILEQTFDAVFLFSIFASVFHVIAVAVERLYAIKFPRKYHIFTTFKMKCGTISIVWVLSLTLTILFKVVTELSGESEAGNYIRGCVFAASVVLVFVTYQYIAFLLLMQRRKNMLTFNHESQDHRLKRLTVLCLFIGISFVVCVLPTTMGYFDGKLYHHFSNILITLNSLINPSVYFIKVFYESKSRKISRMRSETNNALLDTRSCATVTTDIHDQDQTKSHVEVETKI